MKNTFVIFSLITLLSVFPKYNYVQLELKIGYLNQNSTGIMGQNPNTIHDFSLKGLYRTSNLPLACIY